MKNNNINSTKPKTGIEAYNEEFDSLSRKRIEKNSDKPFLRGFYNFMISDGDRSYSGAYNYLSHVINFVNAENITDPMNISLDDYTDYLSKSYRGKSSSHQIGIYSALKEFSKYLVANNICNKNYMEFINRPKTVETIETIEKREKKYLTKDEVDQFINNIINSDKKNIWKQRDLAIAYVFLTTGIRCAALNKLDIDNINFTDNSITVLEKRSKHRKIYLPDKTISILKEWLKYRNELGVNKNEIAVFVSNRKTRMTRKTIYNTTKEYGIDIEEKDVTPHMERSTYATNLYSYSNDVFFVQECMGHSSPTTTKLYIRGQKDNISKKAANIIEDIISNN